MEIITNSTTNIVFAWKNSYMNDPYTLFFPNISITSGLDLQLVKFSDSLWYIAPCSVLNIFMLCIEHIDKVILTAQYPDGRSVGKKAKRQQQQNIKIHSPTLWIITETTIYCGIFIIWDTSNFTWIFAIVQDVNFKSEWTANTFEVLYSLLFIKTHKNLENVFSFDAYQHQLSIIQSCCALLKVWRMPGSEGI